MKKIKEYQVRRQEIIDAAYALFEELGFAQTKIIDITKRVGIAKGTFYHYFINKEEVLDVIVKEIVANIISQARKISENESFSVCDKLRFLLEEKSSQESEKKKHPHIEKSIHDLADESIHIHSLVCLIKELSVILTDVIKEGVNQGIFKTEYPSMVSELILSSASILFDHQFAIYKENERLEKIRIFVEVMEGMLGMKKGSLDSIWKSFRIEKSDYNEQ